MEAQSKYQFSTVKEYFEDSYRFKSEAKVLDVIQPSQPYSVEDMVSIVLEKTIFHPQGGGQPSDKGFLTSMDGSVKFNVLKLRVVDDAIMHDGKFEEGSEFTVG
mmetsp:Transcript_11806/g.19946  ORF Transcript_11806/g.19946 Transcript_11806/m.19946 type:complete len:104 (-) Transcript_11806:558-869(-)